MFDISTRLVSEQDEISGLETFGWENRLLLRSDETPKNFTGRIMLMSMFNDISCGSKDNDKECESNARLVSLFARRFGTGQWSFIVTGSEKK